MWFVAPWHCQLDTVLCSLYRGCYSTCAHCACNTQHVDNHGHNLAVLHLCCTNATHLAAAILTLLPIPHSAVTQMKLTQHSWLVRCSLLQDCQQKQYTRYGAIGQFLALQAALCTAHACATSHCTSSAVHCTCSPMHCACSGSSGHTRYDAEGQH